MTVSRQNSARGQTSARSKKKASPKKFPVGPVPTIVEEESQRSPTDPLAAAKFADDANDNELMNMMQRRNSRRGSGGLEAKLMKEAMAKANMDGSADHKQSDTLAQIRNELAMRTAEKAKLQAFIEEIRTCVQAAGADATPPQLRQLLNVV